jgi:3',5'-cyclic AMP phosphodiesterase CpdA
MVSRSFLRSTTLRSAAAAGLLAGVIAAGCADSAADGREGEAPGPRTKDDTVPPPSTDAGDNPNNPKGDNPPNPDASGTTDVGTDTPEAPEYPLTDEPYTTLQRNWAPLDPPERTEEAIQNDNFEITDIESYDKYGLGVESVEGQPWVEHDELAPGYSEPSADQRESLLYFWQSADPQLVDEESPIRFEGVTKAPVGSTYRPQDHLLTQVFESQVRTARRISEQSGRPFDFAFVSGDMTDGGQKNEMQWAIDILNGGIIDPDTGAEDDPVEGPANDFTDPFWSKGLDVPWYMAVGNHETLYTGTIERTDSVQEAAVGNEVYEFTGQIPGVGNVEGLQNGFRDASTPTGEVVTEGTTPADPDRRILPLTELLEMIHQADGKPDGHGLELTKALDGVGYFSFKPIPGKPIRFIVLNTLMDNPAYPSGAIDEKQMEWLKLQLSEARANDELVIVGGHHRTSDFARLSPVGAGEVEELLASYENVLLYLVGHSHKNAARAVSPGDKRGYWELMCASTVDYPMQTRILELVYDGNGYLSVYVTNVEQNAPPGSPAHKARRLAAGRKVFLWGSVRDKWRGQHEATNLLLRYKLPDELAESVESSEWPDRVESVETLEKF